MRDYSALSSDQIEAIDRLYEHDSTLLVGGMGCVDAATEYLTPTGWVPIADYSGGVVGAYAPDSKRVTFEEPSQYIKRPCSDFIHVKTSRGVDQMLSSEHRVLLASKRGGFEVLSAEALYARFEESSSWRRSAGELTLKDSGFETTFKQVGGGVKFSDAEIRVMVAVKADGYLANKSKCVIRVKKQRKKDRLRGLLKSAGVEWGEVSRDYPSAVGFTVFTFTPPEMNKFYSGWWGASDAQRRIITQEAVFWDGSADGARRAFYTNSAGCADFIQWCWSSTGTRASVASSVRVRTGRKTATEYRVFASSYITIAGLYGINGGVVKTPVQRVTAGDGFKYCFSVSTGFLVLRRNGCIFTTGNSGKTAITLSAIAELIADEVLSRVLIVAPLKVCNAVWPSEPSQWSHLSSLTVACAAGGTEASRTAAIESDAQVVVINFENLPWLFRTYKLGAEVFDGLVIDELTRLKSGGGAQFKALRPRLKHFKWRVGLTGTPVSEDWLGLYGQMLIVDGGASLGTRKDVFKRRYFYATDYMEYNWALQDNGAERIAAAIKGVLYCVPDYRHELPLLKWRNEVIEMPDEVRTAYDSLKKSMSLSVEGGGDKIVVDSAAILSNKLLQLANGFIYYMPVDSRGRELPRETSRLSTFKLDAVMAQVAQWREQGEQVCVVYWFGADLDLLVAEYGEQSKLSSEALERWGAGEQGVLLLHPKSAGHGLNLASGGCKMVWLGPVWSRDLSLQTVARLWRRGQINAVEAVTVISDDTIDGLVVDRVEDKAEFEALLVQHLHQ